MNDELESVVVPIVQLLKKVMTKELNQKQKNVIAIFRAQKRHLCVSVSNKEVFSSSPHLTIGKWSKKLNNSESPIS